MEMLSESQVWQKALERINRAIATSGELRNQAFNLRASSGNVHEACTGLCRDLVDVQKALLRMGNWALPFEDGSEEDRQLITGFVKQQEAARG